MKALRLHIIVIEPLQYMFNHHKYISRINAIVAKQYLWRNCVMKKTEAGLLCRQSLSFKA